MSVFAAQFKVTCIHHKFELIHQVLQPDRNYGAAHWENCTSLITPLLPTFAILPQPLWLTLVCRIWVVHWMMWNLAVVPTMVPIPSSKTVLCLSRISWQLAADEAEVCKWFSWLQSSIIWLSQSRRNRLARSFFRTFSFFSWLTLYWTVTFITHKIWIAPLGINPTGNNLW